MSTLSGRVILVTGANTGVGRATAEQLAARGARLILLCRSAERARAVVETVEAMPTSGGVEVIEVELSELGSVRRGAAAILERAPRIDALVNNAGVGGTRGVTADGFELAFGVNYLSHYLLTRLLQPLLERSRARIVHVTSGSHARASGIDLTDARRRTRSLTGISEYAVSKLCTMLFHHELARRLAAATTLAADPGDVASDGWRHVPWPIRPLMTCSMKSPEQGARSSVHCVVAEEVRSGASYVDARAFDPSPLSRDARLARELWQQSARWVGVAP